MKPPICDICSKRFDPGNGALIRFRSTASGEAFADRQRVEGIVGHPPDDGWFCDEHVEQAAELAETLSLPDALVAMCQPAERRWEQRFVGDDPVCMSCDQAFVTETGGRAVFRVDEAGHRWNDGLRNGSHDGNGPRPYQGWFCSRHIGPAQLVSHALTRSEAMPLLVPVGRDPLEYRECPAGVEADRNADETGEPSRAPFVPVDDGFDPAVSTMFDVAPRVARDTHRLVHAALAPMAVALGADRLRAFGTNSLGSTSYSSSQSDALSAFVMQPLDVGIMIQRREQTLLEIRALPGVVPVMSLDDQPLLERLSVAALSSDVAASIAAPMATLVEALTLEAPDPFELAPDLVGVDLHGAALVRGHLGGASFLEWELEPLDVGEAFSRLAALAAPGAALFGNDVLPVFESTTTRVWNPMDGAVAPSCPYTDTRRHCASTPAGDVTAVVEEIRTHWNDHDVANVSASLSVQHDGRSIRLAASGRGGGRRVAQLSMSRPVEASFLELVVEAFDLSRG